MVQADAAVPGAWDVPPADAQMFVGSDPSHVVRQAPSDPGVPQVGRQAQTGATYEPVPVARLFDTRGDTDAAIRVPVGLRGAGDPLAVRLTGVAGIPASGVAAVDLNVAVTAVEGTGFLAVYPCDRQNDGTARLNFTQRPEFGSSAISVQVLAEPDADGEVCFEVSQRAHIVVDTSGYLPTGGPLRPIPAKRLFDTRDGSGVAGVRAGKPTVGGALSVDVTGVAGVPEDGAAAVLLSVAATRGEGIGFVSVYPCQDGYQETANLNFRATAPVANSVVAPVDSNGEICFRTSVPVDLVVDISAWFADAAGFDPLEPDRAADTRDGEGGVTVGQLTPFRPLEVTLAGVVGVPETGASAVSINLAAARAEAPGYVAVYPCDERWNGTASLNFQPNEPLSNGAFTPLAADGTVCLVSNQPVDAIVDVNAWFGVATVVVDDQFTVEEDSGFSTIAVTANDQGVSAIVDRTQPENGSVNIVDDQIRYIPKFDYCNRAPDVDGPPDEFTYTVEPGELTATVSVVVTCVDDPPVVEDDEATVDQDAAATVIDVLANDEDRDAGPIGIASASDPPNGTVVLADDGSSLTYEPDPGYCNDGDPTDDFTYTLEPADPRRPADSTATVTVTVTCASPPTTDA